MNTMRKAGGEIGGATAEVIQVPSQAPAAGIEMHVHPTGLIDGDVRITLVKMDNSITLQDLAIGFD